MATVEEYTDPFVRTFTPPPLAGAGVCELCHSWTGTRPDGSRYRLCSGCEETVRAVARPVRLVVPVSLYVVGGQLHTVLNGYKNSPDAAARERLRLRVAALAARFLRDHGECIRRAARDWNTLAIVPSSASREGTHPLEQAIRMARAHRPLYRPLLERTEVPLDHRLADQRGFRVTADVGGKRVLLVDDTFTTGARIQSAGSALALAGADVVAAVVLGRVVQPSFSAGAEALWQEQSTTPFDFARCCLEP